jgi:SAM-dependent methyltransferase
MCPPEAPASAVAESYYEDHSEILLRKYEQVSFEAVHADLLALICEKTGSALDVGCGSGRDAAWLAQHGWRVTAVDPSAAMLDGARRIHRGLPIRWMQDGLPKLETVANLGTAFDLVMLSAVWMHVPLSEQARSAATVARLLARDAIVNLTIRTGAAEPERGFHDTDIELLAATFEGHGVLPVNDVTDRDIFDRKGVVWRKLTFRKTG